MGKAKVLSGGSEGLYTIQLDLGKSRVEARIAKLEKQEQDQTARLADLETALTDAEAALEAALETLNTAIQDYTDATNAADPQETEEDRAARIKAAEDKINALTESTVTAKRTEDMARLNRDTCKAQIIETQKAIAAQQAIETEKTMQAWCVDYTEDASGDVATIEIPGEPQSLVIAPGGRAPSASDGILLSRKAMSPEQAYLNAALLPGWQRFKPTYRVGVVSNIDIRNNTCSVNLVDMRSSAQSLSINQRSSYSDVPVEYLGCNASAFEDGDRVVVQMDGREWGNPKVIGFESNPRACQIALIFNVMVRQYIYKFQSAQTQAEGSYPTAGPFPWDWRLNTMHRWGCRSVQVIMESPVRVATLKAVKEAQTYWDMRELSASWVGTGQQAIDTFSWSWALNCEPVKIGSYEFENQPRPNWPGGLIEFPCRTDSLFGIGRSPESTDTSLILTAELGVISSMSKYVTIIDTTRHIIYLANESVGPAVSVPLNRPKTPSTPPDTWQLGAINIEYLPNRTIGGVTYKPKKFLKVFSERDTSKWSDGQWVDANVQGVSGESRYIDRRGMCMFAVEYERVS
jgi:hypothetical protein